MISASLMAHIPTPAHVYTGEEMVRTCSAESFDSTGTTIYGYQPNFYEAQYALIASLGHHETSSERYHLQEGLMFKDLDSIINGFGQSETHVGAEDTMDASLGYVHPAEEQSLRRRSSSSPCQFNIRKSEEEYDNDVSGSKAALTTPSEPQLEAHVAYRQFPVEQQCYSAEQQYDEEELSFYNNDHTNDESEEEENSIDVSRSGTVSPIPNEFRSLLAVANDGHAELLAAEEEACCPESFRQLLRVAEMVSAPVVDMAREVPMARSEIISIGKIPREDQVPQQPQQHMHRNPPKASRNPTSESQPLTKSLISTSSKRQSGKRKRENCFSESNTNDEDPRDESGTKTTDGSKRQGASAAGQSRSGSSKSKGNSKGNTAAIGNQEAAKKSAQKTRTNFESTDWQVGHGIRWEVKIEDRAQTETAERKLIAKFKNTAQTPPAGRKSSEKPLWESDLNITEKKFGKCDDLSFDGNPKVLNPTDWKRKSVQPKRDQWSK